MNLVVFDIDGTLTRTNAADEICFRSAVAQEFAIPGVVTDWGAYTHSTDSGIIDELVEKKLGRKPVAQELEQFKATFVGHLENYYKTVPDSFDRVPGAPEVLSKIMESLSHRVAIATGGWRPSALLKLKKAGISIDNIPAAFADDHFSRDDIVMTAVNRAKKAYHCESFRSITYVGDGRWDFLTCSRLGIPFVGVTDTRGRDYLAKEGVTNIVDDYSDFDSFFQLIKG